MSKLRERRSRDDERGASLLMALVFVFAVGMVISAIAAQATGAFETSYNLGDQRALEANAESAATIAIDNERYIYDSGALAATPSSYYDCMPSGNQFYPQASGSPNRMTVFCSALSVHDGSADSRTMEFTACPVSSTAASPPASCGQVELYAVVVFDDLPPNAAPSADTCPTIATPGLNTCGIAMTVQSWDVRTADN
jgi:hypothetical protein